MMNIKKIFLILFLGFSISIISEEIEVGIDENLGGKIPFDVEFITSDNDTVTFANLVDKPFILALVYYECPGICSPMLTELSWVAEKIQLDPREDFEIVTLSFDHRETPEIAKKWKKNYFNGFKGDFPEDSWTFLTGDSLNVKKITDAVGFKFKPTQEDYLHAGALITVSQEGKISRYIYGSTYNPFDLKMALIDAGSGKTSPTIAKALEFCFSYDPEGRGYTLNITRIIGSIMVIGAGIFLTILIVKKRKNK